MVAIARIKEKIIVSGTTNAIEARTMASIYIKEAIMIARSVDDAVISDGEMD